MRHRCAQARFHEVGGIADIFPAGGGMRTGTADIVADFQQKPAFFTVAYSLPPASLSYMALSNPVHYPFYSAYSSIYILSSPHQCKVGWGYL